jgi:hypothetical protein
LVGLNRRAQRPIFSFVSTGWTGWRYNANDATYCKETTTKEFSVTQTYVFSDRTPEEQELLTKASMFGVYRGLGRTTASTAGCARFCIPQATGKALWRMQHL